MQPFTVHQPETVAEAVQLRVSLDDAHYLAGGTDLLPNVKQGLHQPAHLVHLGGLAELAALHGTDDGGLWIGAGVTLHQVATGPHVVAHAPALAQAAGLVAGPQHRRMGTLGGNVMLDTRCLFYNQAQPWRQALGYCLKKDGEWCHVIGSNKTCVAAQSSDTVPVLIALGAVLHATTAEGEVQVPLAELFNMDGRLENLHALPEEALVTGIRLPPRHPDQRSVYRKVRIREAIDFPLLGVAAVADFDGPTCTQLTVVVGAVMPRPKVLRKMELAHGTTLPDAVIDALAEQAQKQVRPQPSLFGSPSWRRDLVPVEVRRALEQLRDEG